MALTETRPLNAFFVLNHTILLQSSKHNFIHLRGAAYLHAEYATFKLRDSHADRSDRERKGVRHGSDILPVLQTDMNGCQVVFGRG